MAQNFVTMYKTLKGLLLFAMSMLFSCSDGGEDIPKTDPKPDPEPEKPSLTISSSDITPVLDTDGGEVTISFTASDAWSVSVTNNRADSWISVSPTSGEKGEASITITTIPNETYDERNATITLKCGTVTESVDVKQEGVDGIPYLKFIADDLQTFAMSKAVATLEYSVGGEEWMELGTTSVEFGGELGSLRLRGKSSFGTAKEYIEGEGGIDCSNIYFENDAYVSCIGDIRTLIDYENYDNTSTKDARFIALFQGCYQLTSAPELPAMELASGCYFLMFNTCINLKKAPELPAMVLAEECYLMMFSECIGLTESPDLPATTLAKGCYKQMFQFCENITKITKLPAVVLAEECYSWMFYDCKKMVSAPELPATTLADFCYSNMFRGCTGLTDAPELPATTMTDRCYSFMFLECTNLTEAPELPATVLAYACYNGMFSGCKSLTEAPELPATALAHACYYGMFSECTNLTEAPQLPAATMKEQCYGMMFVGCINMVDAPELPATILANYCYEYMFQDCINLVEAPVLSNLILEEGCYSHMFSGCKNLSKVTMLATDVSANVCLWNWLENVSNNGIFTKSKEMNIMSNDSYNPNSLPTGPNGIPKGWEVVDYEE